jgi:transposase
METAYDGRQVVGMDLHRRRSVLVRMTGDGRRLGMAKITNGPAELRKEIARAGKSPKVVLEAAYGWYWAAGTLMAAGAEVHLAHPLGVKAFTYRRVKNDELTLRTWQTCCGWAGCPRRGSPRRGCGTSGS